MATQAQPWPGSQAAGALYARPRPGAQAGRSPLAGDPQLCPLPFPFRPREGSKENGGARSKRALEEEEGGTDVLSKNKQKKQLRNPHKTFDASLKRKLLPLRGPRALRPRAGGRAVARAPVTQAAP